MSIVAYAVSTRSMIRPQDIRLLRIQLRLTQSELADLLGVKQPAISFYENGLKTPREEIMAKLISLAVEYERRKVG